MGERAPSLDDQAQINAFDHALRQAIASLPERYRVVFELRSQQGLTIPEIARILGIPVKTAESRAGRALQAIRVALNAFRK
jgi:RNA polymerase sigma-70 factor (ECF subfamily)